jgi:hypothetical protein
LSIAQSNHIKTLEDRIAALEAAFSRLHSRPAETSSLSIVEDKLHKLANDVQGLKMRMGKNKE